MSKKHYYELSNGGFVFISKRMDIVSEKVILE